MCLTSAIYEGPEKKKGDLVYKLVVPHPTKEGVFSTPWLFKTIRLGKLAKADTRNNIYTSCMPGGQYPCGSHVFPTRAAARAYKNRRHRILQGRLVGKVLVYGGQAPMHNRVATQPVLVVTAVRWERVVR